MMPCHMLLLWRGAVAADAADAAAIAYIRHAMLTPARRYSAMLCRF